MGLGSVPHHHYFAASFCVHDVDVGLHWAGARRALIFGLVCFFVFLVQLGVNHGSY